MTLKDTKINYFNLIDMSLEIENFSEKHCRAFFFPTAKTHTLNEIVLVLMVPVLQYIVVNVNNFFFPISSCIS